MARSARALSLFAALFVGITLLSCGAENLDPPAPQQKQAEVETCRSFDQLMPRFNAALSTGQTEGLREVIHDHLLVGDRPDDPPPINDVLRSTFTTISGFARLPAERGAPEGQLCAMVNPPAPAQANPLCEMRRAMDLLVHQGKGIEALRLVDPIVAVILNYVIGRPPSSSTTHYEVAHAVASMCQQNAVCHMEDTLDLVIAMVAFAETDDGKAALDRMSTLVHDPNLKPFLTTGDPSHYGGEEGVIAFAKVLTQAVEGMETPADLDKLPLNLFPDNIRPGIQAAIADMKLLLDPARDPNVLRPLKKVLNCTTNADKDYDLVRMFFRLGVEASIPEIGLTNVSNALDGVRQTDQRGTLLHLVSTLAKSVRSDDQAINSAAKVCRTLFDTNVEPGDTQSNAERALPVVAGLFRDGVAGEALCAADTLIYGCAGGKQPACEAATSP